MNFKVTFRLDGSGVYYNPWEPIHLDALLAWALAPFHCQNRHIARDDDPEFVPLPLLQQHFGPVAVWRASALLPAGKAGEDLQHWRKRFRHSRADLSTGAPNLTNGPYRDWNMPVPLMLSLEMVAYASGSKRETLRILKRVRYLGKKRAHGIGRIVGVSVEAVDADCSLAREGRAMRWLPAENGSRLVRPMPPYWNRIGRVLCCEVGDPASVA